MRPSAPAVLAAILLALPVRGAGAVERLSGEQIRSAFEGNTVSGRYTHGNLPFSEFHHSDGKASGHNRHKPNVDACWHVVEDGVCYYYGEYDARQAHCFWIERTGELHVIRSRPSGRINGIATIERGDPHRFGEKAAWSCDRLISRAPTGRRELARR